MVDFITLNRQLSERDQSLKHLNESIKEVRQGRKAPKLGQGY